MMAAPTVRRSVKALARWQQLTEFLTIMLWTGHVANGRPQSCFLLSGPGHGKTELLERFRHNPQLSYWSDITTIPLIKVLKDVPRGRTHIVVTEFQKIIARKQTVSSGVLALILQMMEEGVYRVGFGPRDIDLGGARLGVLAASTVSSVRKNPYLISDLAMDSRAYFVDARATDDELEEIKKRIAMGDVSALKPIIIKTPDRKVDVMIPEAVAHFVRGWDKEMTELGVRVYGLRNYTRFLDTLKGVTLMNGRQKATREDADYLYSFKSLWLNPPPLPEPEDSPGEREYFTPS